MRGSPTSAIATGASDEREAIRTGELNKAGITSAADAECALRHVLGVAKAEFYLDLDLALNAAAEREFHKLLLRRERAGRLHYQPQGVLVARFVVTPELIPDETNCWWMALAAQTHLPSPPLSVERVTERGR
jgi:hypothetical protein